MSMIIKEYTHFDDAEILALYSSVGWTAYTDNFAALREGFAQSLLVLAAYEQERLLGIARIVGDAHTIIFIQDLLIAPDYQRRGIATRLVKEVFKRYEGVRQIEVLSDDSAAASAFYRSLGFVQPKELGCCAHVRMQ